MNNLLGIDIGGTKCAVIFVQQESNELRVVDKIRFATTDVQETIKNILENLDVMMQRHKLTAKNTKTIGISCGGPLDSKTGVVMSPPNLPGWNNVPIVTLVENQTGILAGLQNDANACALAEWRFGAGRGTKNMVFMTFGTGLGAGIIINGELYAGTNDNAGELGHIRLALDGPVGYGKRGSFEGFCSGGGIAQMAKTAVTKAYEDGKTVNWCSRENIPHLDALTVAKAVQEGDALAKNIFDTSSRYLGMGLSFVVDILNPELIVIGSIYARNEKIMFPVMQQILEREALEGARRVCRVVPAMLGEQIGDYASLSVAANVKQQDN